MTDPEHVDASSKDDSEVQVEYQCSACQQTGVEFSKRQLKKAQKGKAAQCTNCCVSSNPEAEAEGDDDDDDDEVIVLETAAEAKPDVAGDDNDDDQQPSEEETKRKEEKRLKKEEKRLKKEEKKRAKKERKKERKGEEEKQSVASSSSSESENNSGDEKPPIMGQNENEENIEEKANKDETAQLSEEEEAGKFSEDDGAAKFSDNEGAQFSDQEMSDKSPQIPRKRKANNSNPAASASLIANVQAKKAPAVASMPQQDEEDDFRDSEDEEFDDPGSLAALKQNIMGRKIRTHEDDDEEKRNELQPQYTTDCKISHQLRKELACAICHECFLHPVTLSCGHNFCKECIQWWWQSLSCTNAKKTCPTCRLEIPQKSTSSLGVNTSLRACVLALLGNEVQIRLQAQRQSRKGENEGAHDAGYEVLVSEKADSWKTPGIPWSCRRSSVLDADDQRMQLALAVWKDVTTSGVIYNPRDQTLRVSLCMLQMEEDEVADGGFPRVIHEDDDEDNEQLLVSRQGGRFVHSFVRATAFGAGDKKIPLGRRGIKTSGVAELELELTSPEVARCEYISFQHEESGAVLDLKVPSNFANGVGRQTSGRTAGTALALDDEEEEEEAAAAAKAYDSEDDGSHMDQYENDGFIADEADDGFIADEADDGEDQHEDDLCRVCKKGGDLMVCDGGDNVEGCSKSFHIECVKRQEVPRGDWICQQCAEQFELDVGIEGHEFPMPGFCAKCEADGVQVECYGGDDVKSCGKKFHLNCVEREEYPNGDYWMCQDCALRAGYTSGIQGYEVPEAKTSQDDGDAIEIEESETEASPRPKKKQRVVADPNDVIDVDDSESELEFASPAKGGRHIGGDSDDDDDDDDEVMVDVRPKKAKPARRAMTLDDDSDDE